MTTERNIQDRSRCCHLLASAVKKKKEIITAVAAATATKAAAAAVSAFVVQFKHQKAVVAVVTMDIIIALGIDFFLSMFSIKKMTVYFFEAVNVN